MTTMFLRMRNILTKIGKNWPIGEKKVLTFGVCGIVTTYFLLDDLLPLVIVSQILWVYSFHKIGSVTNNFSALGVLTGSIPSSNADIIFPSL